jgi:hypothetical protein
MPKSARDDLKTIKIESSTHAQLMLLTELFGGTISDVITKIIAETYPEVVEESAKRQRSSDSLRRNLLEKQKSDKQ